MKAKEIVSGVLLSGGWASMLLSITLYLLFWRVDNEPGAKDVPGLLWSAVACCSVGGLAFLGCHIYLMVRKAWTTLFISWGVCLLLLFGAGSVAPVLLLLMV